MFIVIALIVTAVIGLLISFENERITKAKHRAQSQRVLDYIASIDVPRSYRLSANAAGDRWED